MSTSSKYKQSETVVIKRSQINFAPYNPKHHSDEAVKQIRQNIKNVAFLGGIVWNATTGNLIDGHKRVTALDVIHRYDGEKNDYGIKVEKVELDEKTEKEQNIFQTTSRTELDSELLSDLIGEIDYKAAGLSDDDLKLIEVEVPDFDFTETIDATDDFEKMEESKEERKKAMQKKRKANKQKMEGANYVTITFSDFESKAYFMERFGFDQYDEFIKGERFEKMIERID